MKKTSTLLISLLACIVTAHAQTDVTADYLVNPSFEADSALCTTDSEDAVSEGDEGLRGWDITPTGWEATNPSKAYIISADCQTDNSFGATEPADGNYAYYQRYGWGSATSELTQTSSAALAPGEYELTFEVKAFYANSASTTATVNVTNSNLESLDAVTFACEAGSTGIMETSDWTEYTLQFILEEETYITITSDMTWGNGGSCIAYDNFVLTLLPDGTINNDSITIEGGTEDEVESPTEGVITSDFTDESTMQDDLLQMLANSMEYAYSIWYNCVATNSADEECGYFMANSAGNSNEDGVRTNADFSMICAFLYKYAQDKVSLPDDITWDIVKDMAVKSLIFGYSTHKANKLKVTSDNSYWGSVSTSDYTWESSLWAMSLAYSAYFLDDVLSDSQKEYIYNMIKAECNYELNRSIPTGYSGDTKAEENGWETNILACALGLYPDDDLAEDWYNRLREFAINCYSHVDDAEDNSVIDSDYDDQTVADLYVGKNLYDDYTLQNHSYFHTSYQNVVMQELGESQLALLLFQGDNVKWNTNALMHNNQEVMDEVLCRLALADGELAMPNGNDWSMFLYDQIASYATAACFLRDPNALMLENLAYKNIKARQSTTDDGSWLLNSDIGPRRMGVEGHRVMTTYLMHMVSSTADLEPTLWDDFCKEQEPAHLFTSQNIVRANTPARFSVFSWSSGLSSYTGYITANSADKNKIIVPFASNNTGNILGWYTVSGQSTDASPSVNGIYNLNGNSYTMNGKLLVNGSTLENNFTLYSTPGNAFIYMDYVTAKSSGTITNEKGGLMAISTDTFTKETRTLYHAKGRIQTNGSQLSTFDSRWVNIDNEVGIIRSDSDKLIGFGDRELNSSIYLSKIYPSYSADGRTFSSGDIVDRRHIVYYSSVDSATTEQLSAQLVSLADDVAEGWNGVIAADPDSARYLLLSNYLGETSCTLENILLPDGAPVFSETTTITEQGSTATFRCDVNHSVANTLRIYVDAEQLSAEQIENDSCGAYLYNYSGAEQEVQITIWADSIKLTKNITLNTDESISVRVVNGEIVAETITEGEGEEAWYDITDQFLLNPSFEEDETYGTESSVTLNGTTYDPCYINSVEAEDDDYPQILPIVGWTEGNELSGASNYAVLYSMPYSTTMYCVSPSSVGNSASIMAKPAADDSCGTRCLSVLNSWTSGSNRITQQVTLPQGDYKLSFLAQYVCTNEMCHLNDYTISTTGDNINYSLCGISIDDNDNFLYPTLANNWESLECNFTLDEETDVTVSMGLKTTEAVGAAYNTRLYLDQVKLWSKEDMTTGINEIKTKTDNIVDVYNILGMKLRSNVAASEATDGLHKGVYIVGNKKVIVN